MIARSGVEADHRQLFHITIVRIIEAVGIIIDSILRHLGAFTACYGGSNVQVG